MIKENRSLSLTVFIVRLIIAVYLTFFITNTSANPMNTPNSPAPQPITVMPITVVPSNEPPDWRDFRTLSAHPNGEEIFFVECRKDLPEICRVLRLNLKTRVMAYFALPTTHAYLEAYLSPSGKKLAMVRVPQQVTSIAENLERKEIAIMNIDGTGLEVLPLASGPKTHPTFNANDDRLAFWRSKPRKPNSKTLTTGYDVYEYDFKTGKETAFGASYRFFQGGEIHYLLGGDELLVTSDVPLADEGLLGMNVQDYGKRYLNHVFRLKRGQTHWVEPLFARESFKLLSQPALSRDGDMVFSAETVKEGVSIFRAERRGGFSQWQNKIWDAFEVGALNSSVIIGNRLLGIYQRLRAIPNYGEARRFVTLDMQSGEWRAMSIPPISSAKAIPVSMK